MLRGGPCGYGGCCFCEGGGRMIESTWPSSAAGGPTDLLDDVLLRCHGSTPCLDPGYRSRPAPGPLTSPNAHPCAKAADGEQRWEGPGDHSGARLIFCHERLMRGFRPAAHQTAHRIATREGAFACHRCTSNAPYWSCQPRLYPGPHDSESREGLPREGSSPSFGTTKHLPLKELRHSP